MENKNIIGEIIYYLLQPFLRNGVVDIPRASRILGLSGIQIAGLMDYRRSAIKVSDLEYALNRMVKYDGPQIMSMWQHINECLLRDVYINSVE